MMKLTIPQEEVLGRSPCQEIDGSVLAKPYPWAHCIRVFWITCQKCKFLESCMEAYTSNPSTEKPGARRSSVQTKPGLHDFQVSLRNEVIFCFRRQTNNTLQVTEPMPRSTQLTNQDEKQDLYFEQILQVFILMHDKICALTLGENSRLLQIGFILCKAYLGSYPILLQFMTNQILSALQVCLSFLTHHKSFSDFCRFYWLCSPSSWQFYPVPFSLYVTLVLSIHLQ